MAKARVLLVEDESLIRLLAAEILQEEGFEVVEAWDGDEAVRAIPRCQTPLQKCHRRRRGAAIATIAAAPASTTNDARRPTACATPPTIAGPTRNPR